jgi:hypothetical protein
MKAGSIELEAAKQGGGDYPPCRVEMKVTRSPSATGASSSPLQTQQPQTSNVSGTALFLASLPHNPGQGSCALCMQACLQAEPTTVPSLRR